MSHGSGRQIEWYSVVYSTEGPPGFQNPATIPYLEGGLEVRFETEGEALRMISNTPMYLRDPEKAERKFRVVRTRGEIVYTNLAGSLKRFLKNRDTYFDWFEIMYFENERNFDAPFQGVLIEPGRSAAYGTFKDAWNAMMEMDVSDDVKPHYNIVWFQSELLPADIRFPGFSRI